MMRSVGTLTRADMAETINRKLGFSPFERFQVGGDGITNSMGMLGYDIIALRGYPVFETSDPDR